MSLFSSDKSKSSGTKEKPAENSPARSGSSGKSVSSSAGKSPDKSRSIGKSVSSGKGKTDGKERSSLEKKKKKKNSPNKRIDVSSSAYNMSLFSSDKSKSSGSKHFPTSDSTALPVSGFPQFVPVNTLACLVHKVFFV